MSMPCKTIFYKTKSSTKRARRTWREADPTEGGLELEH
jgi:hypothetical protein